MDSSLSSLSRDLFLFRSNECSANVCGSNFIGGNKYSMHRIYDDGSCDNKCTAWFVNLRLRRGWDCGRCPEQIVQEPSMSPQPSPAPSAPPTDIFSEEPSAAPSSVPSAPPSLMPSVPPSLAPSSVPSEAPTFFDPRDKCPLTCTNLEFQTKQELVTAVDEYIAAEGAFDSPVALKYGHPIGSWCVGEIDDFADLFSAERNLAAGFVDYEVDCWDMSKSTTIARMFKRAMRMNSPLDRWNVSTCFLFLFCLCFCNATLETSISLSTSKLSVLLFKFFIRWNW